MSWSSHGGGSTGFSTRDFWWDTVAVREGKARSRRRAADPQGRSRWNEGKPGRKVAGGSRVGAHFPYRRGEAGRGASLPAGIEKGSRLRILKIHFRPIGGGACLAMRVADSPHSRLSYVEAPLSTCAQRLNEDCLISLIGERCKQLHDVLQIVTYDCDIICAICVET